MSHGIMHGPPVDMVVLLVETPSRFKCRDCKKTKVQFAHCAALRQLCLAWYRSVRDKHLELHEQRLRRPPSKYDDPDQLSDYNRKKWIAKCKKEDHHCEVCGKLISARAKLCKSCALRANWRKGCYAKVDHTISHLK